MTLLLRCLLDLRSREDEANHFPALPRSDSVALRAALQPGDESSERVDSPVFTEAIQAPFEAH